jgi:hypothetical protein
VEQEAMIMIEIMTKAALNKVTNNSNTRIKLQFIPKELGVLN